MAVGLAAGAAILGAVAIFDYGAYNSFKQFIGEEDNYRASATSVGAAFITIAGFAVSLWAGITFDKIIPWKINEGIANKLSDKSSHYNYGPSAERTFDAALEFSAATETEKESMYLDALRL